MKYSDFLAKIIYLTKRNNISQAEIGEAIGLDRGAANARAQRDSKFKPDEIKKIEQFFDIELSSVVICDNSKEKQNDTTIPSKAENFGQRITEIQDKYEYLDKDMAKLLRISEEDYIDLKLGDIEPDFRHLVRLKQCFKVSIDWLLFGD